MFPDGSTATLTGDKTVKEADSKGVKAPITKTPVQNTSALTQPEKDAVKKAVEGDGAQFKGYKKLADTYSWTDAGNVAHMYAGIAYFNLGEYKKAIEQLEAFSPQGDATVSANALAALGNAYVADKQFDNGVKYLEKAASQADNDALSPEYLIQAGLVLENQGKKADANALYVRIKNDYPRSRYSQNGVQNGVSTGAEIDKYIERTK